METQKKISDQIINLSKELDELKREYEQMKINLKRKRLEIQNKENEIELAKLNMQETHIPDALKAKKAKANSKRKIREYNDNELYYSQDRSYNNYIDYYKNIKSYND